MFCLALTVVMPVRPFSSPAAAQQRSRGTSAESGAPAKDYAVGDVHLESSRAYIHVGKTGLGHEHAVEGKLQSGVVHLEATQEVGELVFDMASFVADTDAARKYIGLAGTTDAGTRKQVTSNMVGADVLNAQRFPTATFKIDSAGLLPQKSRRGLEQYELNGSFTLHGVTKQIRIVADAETKNGWIHLRGGFPILQTQFGITPFTKGFGAIGVTDRLQIWGDLWIAAEPQVAESRGTTR